MIPASRQRFSRFVSPFSGRKKRPFLPLSLLFLFALFFIFGCSLINRERGPEVPVVEESVPQVVVACTEACANRGQCGEAEDGRSLVLGHPDSPTVSEHQMVFEHQTAMTLLALRDETLQVLATGQQFVHTFYLVTRPGDGRSGWVAGWCVQP
jgi:hypothetical protein